MTIADLFTHNRQITGATQTLITVYIQLNGAYSAMGRGLLLQATPWGKPGCNVLNKTNQTKGFTGLWFHVFGEYRIRSETTVAGWRWGKRPT